MLDRNIFIIIYFDVLRLPSHISSSILFTLVIIILTVLVDPFKSQIFLVIYNFHSPLNFFYFFPNNFLCPLRVLLLIIYILLHVFHIHIYLCCLYVDRLVQFHACSWRKRGAPCPCRLQIVTAGVHGLRCE